jgi:hypothetical protein
VRMEDRLQLETTRTLDGAELRFIPLADCADRWKSFAESTGDATLYHRAPWLHLLHAAHGVKILAAVLEYRHEISAGCLFARSRRPFSRRLVSLPDSEVCGPLAHDRGARDALLAALASHPGTPGRFEIHGVECPPRPWETVDVFAHWSIDMQRRVEMLHRGLDRDVRRNLKHAVAAGISVSQGDSVDDLRRFYALHLDTRRRLGVPPRPFRYFRVLHEVFGSGGALSVWIASRGNDDLAGLVLLRDGDELYAKMNARAVDCPNGANHLLFVSAMDEFAGRVNSWDLGRVDIRNRGLADFKKRLGAASKPLSYAYLPAAPRNISSEVVSGPAQLASQAWRRLPLWTTRVLGGVVYGLLL